MEKSTINNENIILNSSMGITHRVLVVIAYRLYVLPSSLLALWGLLFLCISIVGLMGWGNDLVRFAIAMNIDSINLTNDDFIGFVGITSVVGALFFEVIRLILGRSINYRSVERKLRLILIIVCWPLANFIFSLYIDKFDQSWAVSIFFVGLGISLMGIEVLLGKLWKWFEWIYANRQKSA